MKDILELIGRFRDTLTTTDELEFRCTVDGRVSLVVLSIEKQTLFEAEGFEADPENGVYKALQAFLNKSLPLYFSDFIESAGVKFKDFLDNCRTENQRFVNSSQYYDRIEYLQRQPAENWMWKAFNFSKAYILIKEELDSLGREWNAEVRRSRLAGRPLRFESPKKNTPKA